MNIKSSRNPFKNLNLDLYGFIKNRSSFAMFLLVPYMVPSAMLIVLYVSISIFSDETLRPWFDVLIDIAPALAGLGLGLVIIRSFFYFNYQDQVAFLKESALLILIHGMLTYGLSSYRENYGTENNWFVPKVEKIESKQVTNSTDSDCPSKVVFSSKSMEIKECFKTDEELNSFISKFGDGANIVKELHESPRIEKTTNLNMDGTNK